MEPDAAQSPEPPAKHEISPAELQRIEQDDRRRMLQNVAAFIFILAFLGLSAWLIDRLAAWNRNMTCIQSHRRDCG